MKEIERLIEGYWRWLRDRTATKEINGWVEITTPYLDRHNDYIQIYARRDERGIVLTDDGETISDLELSGCNMDSEKRQDILRSITNGFGIHLSSGVLEVHSTAETFPLRKHNLIQCIMSVNDMFHLASPTVEAIFFEDVAMWLETEEIRFIPRVKFTGKSGFDHMFDFVIPKSRSEPERVVKAINTAGRQTALNFITAWEDTRPSRPENSKPFAFLNDLDKHISGTVLDAFGNYGITPVEWSKREHFRDQLAA